nr:reverse transcriptase domain-containing protein [Tanacetum cinerariifolium]
MEELCQPTLNGQGGPIAAITIQATNFRLKIDMIQQVQNSCQFHGLSGDDANKHLDKFLHVTQSIKVNVVTDDALRLYLFPHSLTYHATALFDRLPRNSINTFEQMAKMFLGKYFPTSMPPLARLRTYMLWEPIIKVVNLTNLKTNMTSFTNSNLELKNMFGQFMKMNTASSPGSGTLPSNIITNPKEDLKGITTRSRNAYKGPMIPTTSCSPLKVVERKTEVTKDTMPPTNNGSTKDVQPPVVQFETPIPNSEPDVAPVLEPVVAPVNASKLNQKWSIPYPSRLHDQKLHDKANDQKEKIFKIFKDLDFSISFADALILMPKFSSTIKSLLTNKEKLYELARTLLNEHCSTIERALIDVYEGEFTLLIGKEAVTFNLDQTSRYFANYDAMLVNQIDLIDVACEEYSQEVLRFFVSGNLTPSTEPIVSTSSPTLTPFGDSDFLLEETDAFLAIDDEPISPKINEAYYDSEGDILLLKEFLNDDPSSPPLPP